MKKVVLEVNGHPHEVLAGPQEVLLDYLRQRLDLTGAKQSCDRLGQCGACTVIVDGKAVLSCLVKLISLDGFRVITVEGLGTPDNPHLIQHAFVLAGAVQCGLCTPGLIMASKALLDRNPDPDEAAIKKALRRNLCRCTPSGPISVSGSHRSRATRRRRFIFAGRCATSPACASPCS